MRLRIKVITFLLAVITASILALTLAGCGNSEKSGNNTSGSDSSGPKVAPDFTLQTLTDDNVNFSTDIKGKPTVLNFAASWCGPCEYEAPVLAKAYQTYKDRVQFFGVAVKDKEEDQRAFAQRHGLEFPIGLDLDGKVLYQYQKAGKVTLSGIPTTFFLDKDGNIVDYFIGPLSEKTFDQKIQSILPGAAGTQTSTNGQADFQQPTETISVPAAP